MRKRRGLLTVLSLMALTMGASLFTWAEQPTIARPAERRETLMAELTPSGFQPAEITYDPAAAGHYLAIQIFVGAVPVQLELSTAEGKKQEARDLRGERRGWMDRVTLSGGVYVLTDTNHPAWQLKIKPRGK